ncbi:uncharacterized protein [Macrobrachium rosenbergii]|uniref:uncharacterized protein isoform X1 n=2 Tax=Macrobrachium rosenbergii TaxID=79674 RepID=UPI0034D6BBDF
METTGLSVIPRYRWAGTIRDNVSVIVYCNDSKCGTNTKFVLLEDNGVYYLPRKEAGPPTDSNQSTAGASPSSGFALWPKAVSMLQVAENLAKSIQDSFISSLPPKLVMMTSVYVPTVRKPYHHYVFAIGVPSSAMDEAKKKGNFTTMSVADIKKLPSSELERKDIAMLAEYIAYQIKGESNLVGAIVREYGPQLVWRQVSEAQMLPDDMLIRSPGYREQDVEMFLEEFIRCSYPHSTVCLQDVKPLFNDLGFKDKENILFRALDRQRIGELDCREFVLGLAALDPLTTHGKGPAEVRCRYIFRYYDGNEDDVLEVNEVRNMVHEIAQLQGHETTPESITEKTTKALEVFGIKDGSGLPLTNFLVNVGNLRFRGTSLLFRANTSVLQHIIHKLGSTRKRQADSQFRSPESSEFLHKKLRKSIPQDHSKSCNSSSAENNGMHNRVEEDRDCSMKSVGSSSGSLPLSEGAFQSPDTSNHTLAQHTVKVRRSGQVTDIHLLLDMERAGEVCDTGLDVDDSVSQDSQGPSLLRRGRDLKSTRNRLFNRFQSVEAFNTKSLPNEMINALRFFEHGNANKPAFDWGEVDLAKLSQYIITLCSATKELMESEPRLLKLSSPCYILGDIHGNYRDLVCFEKALWRVGPHLTPANFLFLGDYVDRGAYGLEVVSYLFAQKVQAPHKFFLLRGNHEVRDIQCMFSFQAECMQKFGERLGLKVWNAINDVFDCMPLAAIVDKKIFCIHGGIPKIDGSLQELEKIPCPLSMPETQSNLAWQLMWNDPVGMEDSNEKVANELSDNDGFAFNEKRQTGYIFNQAAFSSFLKVNGLTHVVRAHEVKEVGFEIQQSGRLMTVFSSSHYCGGSNEAACILVHDYRMRIIRIDTS